MVPIPAPALAVPSVASIVPTVVPSPTISVPPMMPQVAKIGDGIVAIFNSRAMSFFLLVLSLIVIISMLKGFIVNVATLMGNAFADTWNYTITSVQKNLL
jgi:hypothetical protein